MKSIALRSVAGRLLAGSSILAVSVGMAAAAYGQQSTATETVTVTGTIIRGAQPTGSNLITVDRNAIESIGATTIQNVLSTVPGLNNFGGAGQGGVNSFDPAGSQSPTIHSLGSSASNGTLILVDGHRLPYTGNGHSTIDPNSIPVLAVQQVQVLPDGASSTYGSDAVAGVINFITRKNFTGMEFSAQYGLADSYSTFNGGALFGHDWSGGSAMLALDYSSKSELANGSRSFETPRQDLRLGQLSNPSAYFATTPVQPAGVQPTTPPTGMGTSPPYGAAVPTLSLGSNFDNFNCPIATIKSSSGSNQSYLYPYNGSPITNNITGGFNGVCSEANTGTDLPSETRNSVFFSLKQGITDNLSMNVDFDYSFREDASHPAYGTISATVFGPTSNKGTPTAFSPTTGLPTATLATGGQINPFYVGNAATGTSSEYVQYDFQDLMAANGIGTPLTKTFDETAFATFGLVYALGGDWEINLGATGGTDFAGERQSNMLCTACAYLALNGTTNTTGTPNTSIATTAVGDPQALGTITAQGRSLNTGNALDVWDPVASNKTSATVLQQIQSAYSLATGQQALQDVTLKTDGTAFDLPAGPVKIAVGGEYTHNTMVAEYANTTSIGPSALADRTFNEVYGRTVWAAYAEILAPIVSPEMNVPLVQKLDVDISGRYDKYTYYGDTENPKIGFTWTPFDGLQGRGSFGTSFTVPAFNSGGKNGDGITSQSSAGSTTTIPVPTGAPSSVVLFNAPYNRGAGLAGTWVDNGADCQTYGGTPVDANGNTVAAAVAAGCKINGSANQGLSIGGGGGDPGGGIHPEHGRSYSFGFDFDAGKLLGALNGLTGEVTYYQATYKGLITNVNITTSNLGLTTFAPPGGWSPTSPAIVAALGKEPLSGTLPPTIWFYTLGGQNNAYNLWTNGLDYGVHYNFDSDIGFWRAGITGNEILRFTQQNIGQAKLFTDLNGDAGGQGRFQAQQMTFRATLDWALDAYQLGIAFNFQSAFMASNSNFPYNNPTGSLHAPKNFEHISPLETFDLHAGYVIPDTWYKGLGGTEITLTVSNLFDTAPPFFDSATGFSVGSQIGRLVTVALKKTF